MKPFSDDIEMEFVLDNYAQATFKKWKLVISNSVLLDVETTMKDLEREQISKCLAIYESSSI